MWFIFALVATVGWGCADLFYKKGSDSSDRYSHLKIAVWVGLVMGVCAFALMPIAENGLAVISLSNFIKYAPASLAYIISMVIGYAGMRYMEISIISPIQNASGAFSAVIMILYFIAVGRIASVSQEFSVMDIIGTVLIVIGVIALAVVEQRLAHMERKLDLSKRKYKFGALALIFPLLYCLFDTIGTAADGIILDENTGLNLSEIDVIILYGLTFFVAGCICWVLLLTKNKRAYNPFSDTTKGIAAGFEEAGQIFYVYAMARNPVIVAPMVASYCIVSVILSHVFLKEKLKLSQYICVSAVIVGIVLLGISEGLAEA